MKCHHCSADRGRLIRALIAQQWEAFIVVADLVNSAVGDEPDQRVEPWNWLDLHALPSALDIASRMYSVCPDLMPDYRMKVVDE